MYTIKSVNDNVCSINGNKLVALNEGECIITGVVSETRNYLSSKTPDLILNVKSLPQTDLIIKTTPLYYNSNISVSVTGGNSSGQVSITSQNDNCTISNFVIYGKKAGKCVLTITKEGDNVYSKIIKDLFINVAKIQQTAKLLDFNPTNKLNVNSENAIPIIIEGIEEQPTIRYFSTNFDVCYIKDSTIIPLGEGESTIYAILSETTNYSSTKTNEIKVVITKKSLPVFDLNNLTNISFLDAIALNGVYMGFNIKYTVDNPNCTILGNTLIASHAGKCILTATINGNNTFDDLVSNYIVNVNKIYQSTIKINIENYSDFIYVNPNISYNIINT